MLLHILHYSMDDVSSFDAALQMLEYLILRRRGSFFKQVVAEVFGANFQSSQVQLYSLFSRQELITRFYQQKVNRGGDVYRTPTTRKENVASDLGLAQVNKNLLNFVIAELKIFKTTLSAIEKTTEHHLKLDTKKHV